jgi:(heptosyl)LPS beta-1,4-glucosyltransferase
VKRIPASACILAKDEEENLPRCLEPLREFAEVVVLDTGSEDRTVEIATKWGARVIRAEWEGFGKTRKKLFEAAGQPWILWLDADEVAPPGLVEEIRGCAEIGSDCDGYAINRITYIGSRRIRHGLWYPDWNLRFFRKTAWTMVERDVHESVRVPGTTGRFVSRLDHFSYRNWEDRRARAVRYARLWAAQAFRDGRRATLFDQVGHGFGCFVKGYFLKLGFLDGIAGLRLAVSTSSESADKYRRLRRAWARFGA